VEEATGPWGIGCGPGTGGLTRSLKGHGFTDGALVDAYLLRPGRDGRPTYEF
jgi:hypothetical protein